MASAWTTPRRFLPAILLLALAMRAGFLVRNWNSLEFDASFLLHAEVARHLLDGHIMQKDTAALGAYIRDCRTQRRLIDPEDYAYPTPARLVPLYNDEGGYGILLALTWKVSGAQRWWGIRVFQAFLDTLMVVLVYRIGRRLRSETTGLTAAALYAVFIPGIEMAVRPHRDIWVTFLFITTSYVLVRRVEGVRMRDLLLLGVATGAVAWMRSTVVPFVLFAAAVLMLIDRRPGGWRRSGALIGGFLLVFVPLLVRNAVIFDKFMATRGAFWHSFWAGVGQMPNPYGMREDDMAVAAFAFRTDPSVQYETEGYERLLKQQAFEFVREHPTWYITSVARRATLFVFPRIGRALFFQPTPEEQQAGFVNHSVGRGIMLAADLLLGLLFLAGIWLFRARWALLMALGIPYLFTLCTLAPFYVTGRNIANVYYVILLVAAAAAAYIFEQSRPAAPAV